LLQDVIQEKRLQNMIPLNDPRMDRIASQAPAKVEQLCRQWGIPLEVGRDLVKLALFDIILYIGRKSKSPYTETSKAEKTR
jgi:hypothetical protein